MSELVIGYTITKKARLKWNSRPRCSKNEKFFVCLPLVKSQSAAPGASLKSLCQTERLSESPQAMYTQKTFQSQRDKL